MTDMAEGRGGLDIDAALAGLARDVERSAPRPGPDLVARVLADAATAVPVTGGSTAGKETVRASGASGLIETLFGWTSAWTGGAVAAMALSLAIGIGVGMELEPGDLPMTETDPVDEYVEASANLLQDEFL